MDFIKESYKTKDLCYKLKNIKIFIIDYEYKYCFNIIYFIFYFLYFLFIYNLKII
jgi:hypothetical protein